MRTVFGGLFLASKILPPLSRLRGQPRRLREEIVKCLILATVLALAPVAAHADLFFTQSPCGGIGETPCDVVQAESPPVNAAPLTQEAFRDFYAWDIGGQLATFFTTKIGSNADYEFGFVSNSVDAFFHTMYVDGPNGLICCTTDEPWRLIGINASNLLIGSDGFFPFVATAANAETPLPFSVVGRTPNDGLDGDEFLAIDDGGNILAHSRATRDLYELHPVVEPAAVWLLLAGMASLIGSLSRRSAMLGRRT